jgi:O-6-methylguanine DNA methyltransferase
VPSRTASLPASAPRTVRTVGLGIELPGVRSVRVTTAYAGGPQGGELIERIEPVSAPVRARVSGRTEERATQQLGDGSLAGLLAELCRGTAAHDGDAVGVLVDGSPFAVAVLDALRRVPAGTRVTYAELASAAGRPRAVRAAASVMARNRVPLVLPCHRVVPGSGGTGRYAWGGAVKVALLESELASELSAEVGR